jgi:hypothetical protein
VQTEEQTLADAEGQPTVSTRRLEARTGASHAFLHRSVKEHQLYPYRIQLVQELNINCIPIAYS